MELILLNLKLLGELHHVADLSITARLAAQAAGVRSRSTRSSAATPSAPRPASTPRRSSRPRKGHAWLADRIYSGVPAGMFGREQEIEIGFMSGASNVNYWLKKRGFEADPGLARFLLEEAKRSSEVLTEAEVWASVRRWEATHGRSIPDLRFAG